MKFKIEFESSKLTSVLHVAYFLKNTISSIANHVVAGNVERFGRDNGSIRDEDGNTCGTWKVEK